jgi:SAM-dependent methyltransferase
MIFDTYGQYYDLLYRDKDYSSEAEYVNAMLSRYANHAVSILEFGSGTGRHGRALTKYGYTVHGIELSPAMIAATEFCEGFTCEEGDIEILTTGRKYDAVVSLFHVMSYQVRNSQLRNVFANAAQHLNSGGLFLFDFWYSPAVYAQRPSVRIKRASDATVTLTRIAEPVVNSFENRIDIKFTIFATQNPEGLINSFQETHSLRHFSIPELDQYANASGFERVVAEELVSGRAPSEGTWAVCIVFRRK